MIETIILFWIAILIFWLWKSKKPDNFPPGPPWLPLMGNIFHIYLLPTTRNLHEAIEEWSHKYGSLIGFGGLGENLVLVTGVDNILAALRKEEFGSRPDSIFIRDRSFGKTLGLFFSSGDQWASTRKFVVKQIRAFSKNDKENVMSDEISQQMEMIKDGSTIQAVNLFNLAALNVVWMAIASKRIDVDDKTSQILLNNVSNLFRQGNPSGVSLFNVLPFLKYFGTRYKFSQQVIHDFQNYMRRAIQEHREVLDPNNPRDLIDHYLVEMDKNKHSPYFTEEDLIVVGFDLFGAASESTGNSIDFVMLYMVLYPEVQARMQQELDQVLGRSRRPTLDDKAELHYTMAVLTEVERLNSIAPTNVMYNCDKDTTFGGYFVPKNTVISMNLKALGNDPKYWKNPDDFDPGRFLDTNGKYTKPQTLFTFGLGARSCVGEVLARNMIFLYSTTFFEKFAISLPPGDPKPSTVPVPGFTTAPRPFRITIKSRY